jgi:hypothetical protein
MGFKLGVIVGAAGGYYLGAKAGRQRYEQMNRALRRLRRSETFEAATDRAKSTLEDGVGKAKDLVGSKLGDGDTGGPPGNGTPPSRFS